MNVPFVIGYVAGAATAVFWWLIWTRPSPKPKPDPATCSHVWKSLGRSFSDKDDKLWTDSKCVNCDLARTVLSHQVRVWP